LRIRSNRSGYMDRKRLKKLRDKHLNDLLNDTLAFWLEAAPDREFGGFFNYLDRDGAILSTDKPVWVLCRFTWLLSLLYNNLEKRQLWLDLAANGFDFIRKYCFDSDNRMFFEVTRQGRPLRKRRYVFTEAFGVMAFCEYAIATGDAEIADQAKTLYRQFINYYKNSLLPEPKINPRTRPSKSHAMTMIVLCVCRQMRKLEEDPQYDQIIDDCIDQISRDFMHPKLKALLETVAPDGSVVEGPQGRCVNPGHAIETAWFIAEEAARRDDSDLLKTALRIIDWSLALGWDSELGGIRYFVDAEGKPPMQLEHDMKLWWPHTEAIYATLLAWSLTDDPKYLNWHDRIYKYAYSHFPDAEFGEWFKYLHRDGTLCSTIKGNTWAGPFHLPRMQYNCFRLLGQMLDSDADRQNDNPNQPDIKK